MIHMGNNWMIHVLKGFAKEARVVRDIRRDILKESSTVISRPSSNPHVDVILHSLSFPVRDTSLQDCSVSSFAFIYKLGMVLGDGGSAVISCERHDGVGTV